MLELFAIVREHILARRDPERLAQELAEIAAMTDGELDDLERLLTSRREKNG
jgi:hypothetical protein